MKLSHRFNLKNLFRRPASAAGTVIFLLFVALAILGPLITPYTATEQTLSAARQAPSAAHWFGTDHLGRDIFSRVIIGSRSILGLAGLGTLLAVISGTFFGLISGYRGGWFDEIIMRFFDSLLAVPALLLALLLLGTVGPSRSSILIVIVIVYTPIVARVVRSEVLATKSRGFVEAARLQGESTANILLREILPSALPALTVEASLRFSYAIFLVASLGFLGVGVQPPTPDWGLMVNEARNYVRLTPWSLFFPAAAISTLVIGVNLMADGLKRILQATTITPAPKITREPVPILPTEPVPVLNIRELTVSYFQNGDWLDAVRDVSLKLSAGEVYGLVGESGSGKSTLALAVMRYLKENGSVRKGEILFEGRTLLDLPSAEMEHVWGARTNLVPQDPFLSLNPSLRVGEQIAEALRHHRQMNAADARAETIALLRSVRLPDPERVADSYPHQLSGGMQQRAMIAIAFATDPALLILYEPTTALDVTTEAAILDLLRELMAEHNTATLYVSHNLGVIARISDRVTVLYAGELVEDAATEDLYRQPLHPYTQGLLDSVPRVGQTKSAHKLSAMSGNIPPLDDLPSGCIFAPRCPLAIELCHAERPPLETPLPGRTVRCHRWEEILAGQPASEAPQPAGTNGNGNGKTPQPAFPVLSLENVKQYFPVRRSPMDVLARRPKQWVKAVDGVSLEIRHGKTLGLVGESGSGKTTLSRAVMALVEKTGGNIELLDTPLPAKLNRRPLKILRQLQMIFQSPEEALNPYLTIGQTLSRPLTVLLGQSKNEAQENVAQLLKMVRLPENFAERLPGQLSGGEKQRVAIARAFAANPELVVCDEPVSALDVSVQAAILNLLNELQHEKQSAYLFISHDLAVVSYLADEIAVIYLGQLVEIGKTEDVLKPPFHPYTEALLSAVPQPDPTAYQDTIRLEGDVPSPTDIPTGCRFHTRCPLVLESLCHREEPSWQETESGKKIRCHIPLPELKVLQGVNTVKIFNEMKGGKNG